MAYRPSAQPAAVQSFPDPCRALIFFHIVASAFPCISFTPPHHADGQSCWDWGIVDVGRVESVTMSDRWLDPPVLFHSSSVASLTLCMPVHEFQKLSVRAALNLCIPWGPSGLFACVDHQPRLSRMPTARSVSVSAPDSVCGF